VKPILAGFSLVLLASAGAGAVEDIQASGPVTLTSRELEIVDNGAKTIFTGSVILTQADYTLYADRMVRVGEKGPVDASGNVRGVWKKASGERLEATGAKARYEPQAQTIELWGNPRMRRWETAVDTAPVVIDAERFIAYRRENTLWAKRKVRIRQADRYRVECHEAKYDRTEEKIYLWGSPRMSLHVNDERGIGDFTSARGWVALDKRQARLLEDVKGRVHPRAAP
jgi:lipopolysaccharide transport protein LptA